MQGSLNSPIGRCVFDSTLLVLSTTAAPLPEEPNDFSEEADSGTDVDKHEAGKEPKCIKTVIAMVELNGALVSVLTKLF